MCYSLHHASKNDPEMYYSECIFTLHQLVQTFLQGAARHMGNTELKL